MFYWSLRSYPLISRIISLQLALLQLKHAIENSQVLNAHILKDTSNWTNMQKVGSSSPFPSYQHNPSPRYHPHSQREDHGDVEYVSNPDEDNAFPVHRMMLPKSGRENNVNSNNEDELRQERLEKSNTSIDDQGDYEKNDRETFPDEDSREEQTISNQNPPTENENQTPHDSSEIQKSVDERNNYSRSQNNDQEFEENEKRDQHSYPEENEDLNAADKQQWNEKGDFDQKDIQEENLNERKNQSEVQEGNDEQSSEWISSEERPKDENDKKETVKQENEQQQVNEKNDREEEDISQEKQESKPLNDKDNEDVNANVRKDDQQTNDNEWHSNDRSQQEQYSGDEQVGENSDHAESNQPSKPENEGERLQTEEVSADQGKDHASENIEQMKQEDKVDEKKDEAKPSEKQHPAPSFVSQAKTRFEERDEKEHADIWNKPNARAEEPPSEHHLRNLSTSSSSSTVSWTNNTVPTPSHKPDPHVTAWSKEQEQNHLLQQKYLASQSSPSEATNANVTFAGVAIVTVPETPPPSQSSSRPSTYDLELEHERIARLQSETARLHGGIVPKHSDVSFAQSEVDRLEHERLRQLQEENEHPQQSDEERVVIPVVIETSNDINVTDSIERQKEESERLHHVHDNIMEEIKSCPHLDSFDKSRS